MTRLEILRKRMLDEGMDSFLFTSMSDIYYLTGFTGSTAYLFVNHEKSVFITDGRYEEQSSDEVPSEYEILIVKKGYVEETVPLIKSERSVWVSGKTNVGLVKHLEDENMIVFVSDTTPVDKMRMTKDDEETSLIKDAFRVAGEAFLESLNSFKYGDKESVWAAHLEFNMKKRGAKEPSFETIVGSGFRGALPHGMASGKITSEGEPVVIDFGAKCAYCSDITRMVYDGDDQGFFDNVEVVREAQLRAIEVIRPGVMCKDVDGAARDVITKAGMGANFNHSLGHSLGIDVHERPVFSMKENMVLEKGMVLTVEPGVYFPGKYGIRLEDTILVTENGCENLTTMLDKYVYNIL